MLVQELIEKLQQYPPNAEISIVMGEDNQYSVNPDLFYETEYEGKPYLDIDIQEYEQDEHGCYDFSKPVVYY